MDITLVSSPDKCTRGDHIVFRFTITKGKLLDLKPCEETYNVGESDEKEIEESGYRLNMNLSNILGIEIKKDFVPSEAQQDQIEGFVIELLRRLDSKVGGNMTVRFDATEWIVVVRIDGQKVKGLTWQDIKDAIK